MRRVFLVPIFRRAEEIWACCLFSGKRAERRMSARNRLCKAAEKRDGHCRGGDGGPGNSRGELGKCGEKTGAGPDRSVEIEKDDFCFPAAEGNVGNFSPCTARRSKNFSAMNAAQTAAAVVFGVGKRAAFGEGRALAVPLKTRRGATERRSVPPGGLRRAVRGGHETERINFQRYFQNGKAMGWTDTEGRGMRESGGAGGPIR